MRLLASRLGLALAPRLGHSRITVPAASQAGRHQSSFEVPRSRPLWFKTSFWRCRHTWARARVNTFRCLIGCSIGDLSVMSYLTTYHSELDMATVMGLSMTGGIATSIALETILLRVGKDRLPLRAALHTACGMSLFSMFAMEATENCVTLALAGESFSTTAGFWAVTLGSMMAGFIVPLPYNYFKLKHLGKSCH